MKFTSAISLNVSGAIELGVAALRAMMGLQPELIARTSPNRPNTARNLPAGTFGLDVRLDAIRRAGL